LASVDWLPLVLIQAKLTCSQSHIPVVGFSPQQPGNGFARDYDLSNQVDGVSTGIGPIDGQAIPITEMDFQKGSMRIVLARLKVALRATLGGMTEGRWPSMPIRALQITPHTPPGSPPVPPNA
jgi:hypothetical protein